MLLVLFDWLYSTFVLASGGLKRSMDLVSSSPFAELALWFAAIGSSSAARQSNRTIIVVVVFYCAWF